MTHTHKQLRRHPHRAPDPVLGVAPSQCRHLGVAFAPRHGAETHVWDHSPARTQPCPAPGAGAQNAVQEGEDVPNFMLPHTLVQGRKEILNRGAQGGSHPLHGGSVAPPELLPAAGQGMKTLLWKTRATTRAHVYGCVYAWACACN